MFLPFDATFKVEFSWNGEYRVWRQVAGSFLSGHSIQSAVASRTVDNNCRCRGSKGSTYRAHTRMPGFFFTYRDKLMLKQIQRFLTVTGIYLLLSLVLNTVEAQNLKPEVGVRVSWPANTSAEGVEKYIVSWFDGSSDQWIKLADVNHLDDQTLSYVTRLVWIKSTLQANTEICFNVVARKGDELSPASGRACGVIPDRFAIVEVPEVTIIELSAPAGVTIEWLDN